MNLLERALGFARPVELPPKPARTPAEHVERTRERHAFEQQQAEREATRRRLAAERTRAAEAKARRLQDQADVEQRAWADRREELRSELANARHAAADLGGALDLSSRAAAVESVHVMALRTAAAALVERAEQAVADHERSLSGR